MWGETWTSVEAVSPPQLHSPTLCEAVSTLAGSFCSLLHSVSILILPPHTPPLHLPWSPSPRPSQPLLTPEGHSPTGLVVLPLLSNKLSR